MKKKIMGRVSLCLVVLAGAVCAQGVADVARQNQRKNNSKARIVITNRDLRTVNRNRPRKSVPEWSRHSSGRSSCHSFNAVEQQFYNSFFRIYLGLELARRLSREKSLNTGVSSRQWWGATGALQKELAKLSVTARKSRISPAVSRQARADAARYAREHYRRGD